MNFDTPASSSLFSSPGAGGMDSAFGSGTPALGGAGGSMTAQDSAELQEFLAMEQEKARMRLQVRLDTIRLDYIIFCFVLYCYYDV